jgi:putative tricarboxylic transport membrane protein
MIWLVWFRVDCSALVAMLTLSVPGSGTTAVLLASLVTLIITPGPTLFTDRPEVIRG